MRWIWCMVAMMLGVALATLFVELVRHLEWLKGVWAAQMRPEILSMPRFEVTMMFLITKELRHPGVWEYWTQKADEWSAETFGEGTVLLNFATHSVNGTESMPEVVRSRVLDVPLTNCRWGHTAPCMHQLLEGAVKSFPNSSFYIFVSGCAVPLKPFSYIYQEMSKNSRSRFSIRFFNWVFAPRHSQWIVLNNNHAKQLADHPALWKDARSCKWTRVEFSGGERLIAADDEMCPLQALTALAFFGEDVNITTTLAAKKSGAFPRFGGKRPEGLWEEINDGLVPAESVDEYNATSPYPHSKTFVCFKECAKWGLCAWMAPCNWHSFYGDELRDIMTLTSVWFTRKLMANAEVIFLDSTTAEAKIISAMEDQAVGSESWKLNYAKLLEKRRSEGKRRAINREAKRTPIGEWIIAEMERGLPYGPEQVHLIGLDDYALH